MSSSEKFVFVVFINRPHGGDFKPERIVREVLDRETATTLAEALGLDIEDSSMCSRIAWGRETCAHVVIYSKEKMEEIEAIAKQDASFWNRKPV